MKRVAAVPDRTLENFFKTLATLLIGVALGLFATYMAVERGYGFGAVTAGAWTAWPKSGSNEADPYARAVVARTGEIPLGLAEGLMFVARADDDGAPFDPKCDYTIRGPMPPTRYWTITLMDPHGLLIENEIQRYGFTSAEIVRERNVPMDVIVSVSARPGNWLPIGQQAPFIMVLRLYDTIVRSSASAIEARSLPAVTRGRCA